MGRILIGFIALILLLMAVLPLFGFNLILVLGPAAVEPFDPSVEPIYLFVGRSAGWRPPLFCGKFLAPQATADSCCTALCMQTSH